MTAQTKGQLLVLKCLLMKDFFFFYIFINLQQAIFEGKIFR